MVNGKSILFRLTVGGLGLVSAVACANSPETVAQSEPRKTFTEEAEGQAITNSAALDAKAHDFVEIAFMPGSAALTNESKTYLTNLIAQANKAGKIDEVLVLSWADEEYPSTNVRKLSDGQRQLAEKRNETVKKYLTTNRKMDVDVYNMAEQPNTFAKWFNTKDNKLKNSLVAAGLPTTADDPQYPSKASHAVVLVKVE